MTKPKLLDLYCGAGGCSMGYYKAGFEITGVDSEPQKNYPFEFIQADALEVDLSGFDVIHASPPCQAYSRATEHLTRGEHPKLIEATRQRLINSGAHWVIENVAGSDLIQKAIMYDNHYTVVCGTSLGLRIKRHRIFESDLPLERLECRHDDFNMINPHKDSGRLKIREEYGRVDPETIWRRAMGVEWMNRAEGREAIPPAYTKWIGKQIIDLIG